MQRFKLQDVELTDPKVVEPPGTLFTGRIGRQKVLIPGSSTNFVMNIIHFDVGVRNKFHIHSTDQILIVTDGQGYVVNESETIEVSQGDIIFIPEGEVHWHGAQEDSSFAHISLQAAGCKTSQIEE